LKNNETILLHFRACRLKGPREFDRMRTLMESYMACNGYNFMVYQILHQAHLFEVSITQNLKTMILQNLKILATYCVKDPHEYNGSLIEFGCITLFRSITVFCGTNSIPHNISTFNLNVENIP
jgi:hypothetical protein